MKKNDVKKASGKEFDERLGKIYDELKWLYMELYDDMNSFSDFVSNLKGIYNARNDKLKAIDRKREKNPDWFKEEAMVAMNIDLELFCGSLKNLENRLDYLEKLGINYIHLLPIFEAPEEMGDNGFAVTNFRNINPRYGTNEDLISLTEKCHKKGILLSTDFVINHTSDRHEWALRAKDGDSDYISRYVFFDGYDMPSKFETTVPCRLPNIAPGNFTYINCLNKHVMTSFNHYQWDLNYANPVVFCEMVYNLLFVANLGVDVLNLIAIEYIWKELHTRCRGLKQTHNILRMIRLVTQVVCPSVLLSAKIDDDLTINEEYFGTPEKPECQLVYNDNLMVNIWNAMATRDVRMLKEQLTTQGQDYAGMFLNYLRSFEEINFFLPSELISRYGFDPVQHRKFLGEFFRGVFPDSFARGELFSFDPYAGELRGCGTTASLCGLEKAIFENDKAQIKQAISRIVMLYTFLAILKGSPIINSEDEFGQINDYSYKEDSTRLVDSKNLHKIKFDEEKAKKITKKTTVEGKIFSELQNIAEFRKKLSMLANGVAMKMLNCEDNSVLALSREKDGKQLVSIFNFSEQTREISFADLGLDISKDVKCKNLKTGKTCKIPTKIKLDGYAFAIYFIDSNKDEKKAEKKPKKEPAKKAENKAVKKEAEKKEVVKKQEPKKEEIKKEEPKKQETKDTKPQPKKTVSKKAKSKETKKK